MPAARQKTGTIAGANGAYFHKQYGGIKQPKIEHSDKEAALLYLARNADDADDLIELAQILGIDDVIDQVRNQQREARE